MLSGDNGILQKATDAKTKNDEAQIKERIQLAYHSALTGGQGSYTKESLEEELEKEFGEGNYNVDDSDDTEWILTGKDNGNEQSITISAGTSAPTLTIGSEYDKGNIKIGDEMTYKGTKDWIVFGKDESGNILLTSKAPVGSYSPSYNAQHWLTWEDDLDTECAEYSSTLQGKTITARSIRIDDINRAVGFTAPTSTFNRYQFVADNNTGTREDGVIKLNCYYPSDSDDAKNNTTNPAGQKWMQKSGVASVDGGALAPDSDIFINNEYWYYWDSSANKWKYELRGNGQSSSTNVHYLNDEGATEVADYNKFNTNMKFVVGTSDSFMQYFVASRSVYVQSTCAYFAIDFVMGGGVNRNNCYMCYGISLNGNSSNGPSGWGLRPIVELPSDIQIKEVTAGIYDIK